MLDEQLKALGFPKASRVDRAIFKKMVLESGTLDATDKKALKDDVERIRWLYSLKPDTCGIAAHITEERDYGEVAVLSVELGQSKRAKRVATILHEAIPYPLLLWLVDNNRVALSVADKRNSQADTSKWVLEDHWLSPWLTLPPTSIAEQAFWEDTQWKQLPATDYWVFYQGWKARVLALLSAQRTGHYQRDDNNPTQRIATLSLLDKLEQERAELKNRLKREKQMGRQVALTTELHRLNEQLAHHTQQL